MAACHCTCPGASSVPFQAGRDDFIGAWGRTWDDLAKHRATSYAEYPYDPYGVARVVTDALRRDREPLE